MYLPKLYYFMKNGYFYFYAIKLLLLTEIIIFLTLFFLNFYYLVSIEGDNLDILLRTSLGKASLFSKLTDFFHILLLSSLLLEIKLLLILIGYFSVNIPLVNIIKELILIIIFLSGNFLLFQSIEFYLEPFFMLDSILNLSYLSLVSLHYSHVFLGLVISLLYFIYL